jgi:hypothetical protein
MVTFKQMLGVGVVLGAVAVFAACASGRSVGGPSKPPAQPVAEPARTPERGGEGWQDVPMYKSGIRMRTITSAVHEYARKHGGAAPPDLGTLLALIPEKDDDGRPRSARERALMFLSPADEARIEVPEVPTAEWVNKNTSYAYLGNAEVKLNVIPDWSAIAIMVEKAQTGYPSTAAGFEGIPVFPIAFVDSHVSIEQRAEVDRVVAASKEMWQAARGAEPQPDYAPPMDLALHRSMIRMRNLLMAVQIYAADHDEALPPDLWSLVPYLPGVDEQGRPLEGGMRLKGLLSPRDDSRVDLPAEPTETWVKENASFVYLGRGGVKLGDIGDWATTVLLHEKSLAAYPGAIPAKNDEPVKDEVVPLGYLDGHVDAAPKAKAGEIIKASKKRVEAAVKR